MYRRPSAFLKKIFNLLLSPLVLLEWQNNGVFWSLDEVVGDLRSHVCPYVRTFVRSFVRHAFSRKPFITFFLKLGSYIEHGTAAKMFQADFLNKPLILFNPLKNEVFRLFFGLVHQNCLIFGSKGNLDNTYTWVILKFFWKFLIPSNPLWSS